MLHPRSSLCHPTYPPGLCADRLISWMVVSLVLVIGIGGLLTASNPVDTNVLKVWRSKGAVVAAEEPPGDGFKYCLVCKAYVVDRALHCRYCDKCVPRLDHHCFYVNNCIGERNYRLYLGGLCSVFAFSLSHAVVSVVGCIAVRQGQMNDFLLGYSLSSLGFKLLLGSQRF
ncbi:zf-DHHC-domain-containing protein [Rhizoclosmatium globosum]|uniref:Palmitoyltransferase n=1 Tax=Rhizoclosmatium globosum TaxID=329046 RepID=A0A1Y2CHZ8_9FUNG|nr:zf-DHHC-domain-containing protein [Rhizoclosmatium globosum]|eukprot:ORY46537.1 zf-DHHC-domain-containing protein [Rhizoclosmatium globosum]